MLEYLEESDVSICSFPSDRALKDYFRQLLQAHIVLLLMSGAYSLLIDCSISQALIECKNRGVVIPPLVSSKIAAWCVGIMLFSAVLTPSL